MLHILFAITFILGPVAGASYALANGMSPLETTLTVTLFHLLLVPIWFLIFRVLRYEALRFVRIVGRGWEKKLLVTVEKKFREFEERMRGVGLGVAVFFFTLLFGVSWAALLASVLNVKTSAIFPAVTAGAVVSSIFWSIALSGIVGFLPDPTLVYLVALIVAAVLAAHGKLSERKLVKELAQSLKVIRKFKR
ncbi:MAG: small multi-drug export protein [Candidatus Hadarchaeales archaeon]